jgi:hypothetical protein
MVLHGLGHRRGYRSAGINNPDDMLSLVLLRARSETAEILDGARRRPQPYLSGTMATRPEVSIRCSRIDSFLSARNSSTAWREPCHHP